MKKIIIGEKLENLKYDFRETCFGICMKDNKVLVTYDKKYNQYSLIGGGIESGENYKDTLEREFLEEVGIKIKDIKPLFTIDCFWMAGGDYPMESLANFYSINIDEYLDVETESEYFFIDINELDLPLPYQRKAIEIYTSKK